MTAARHFNSSASVGRRFFVLGTLALSACVGGSPPRDTYYRLGEIDLPLPMPGGPIEGVLDVPPFRAAGIINERALLFRDGPSQLSQYSYHHWFEPTGALLQRVTIDTLRRAQAFDAVTSPELRLDRDFELLGNIRRFEHVPAESSVVVEIEVSLRQVRGNHALILKTYIAEAPVAGSGVPAAVAAFTAALESVFGDLLNDIAALKV